MRIAAADGGGLDSGGVVVYAARLNDKTQPTDVRLRRER